MGVEENGEVMGDEMIAVEGEEEDLEDEEALASPNHPLPNLDPPPSHLREISTLASWTVSSSKPGCSIPQLRHPSTALFWQSDGPQPHYLNIHFFKLVRIVGLRLYLDFEQDESYTPTRIIFLAGSGMNDLQEWGEMKLESPRGWIWADFSGVGDPDSDSSDADEDEGREEEEGRMILDAAPQTSAHDPEDDTDSEFENFLPPRTRSSAFQHSHTNQSAQTHSPLPVMAYHAQTPNRTPFTPVIPSPPRQSPSRRKPLSRPAPKMPVLRAHLVQVKILENHQNGKDTHLRGLQIFARNDEAEGRGSAAVRMIKGSEMKLLTGSANEVGKGGKKGAKKYERLDLGTGSRSAWDVEPSIR
ncbi:galactose-binding like protein [Dothidotthia symphoricarpi CBS 119687]|uniref:Galactose-binding like protein n=1 Tax=Dothidotthia symphoricarpi CBS 119687 TaxID=1392245 RepID=A0A6A5ZVD8_9PLEO|nr:galactose-binding like protein [Dothidotthia symphoricarpi CBS 119687]KAF2123469.1 galactose-binding like protein [Dothidotthia symphoricarpi CBS 119687]